jgi:hypothetical protein
MIGLAAVAGAMVGAGLAVLIYALIPASPKLDPALSPMQSAVRRGGHNVGSAVPSRQAIAAWGGRTGWLRLSDLDLDLAGLSQGDVAVRKLTAAAIGFALPGSLVLVLAIFGVRVPFAVPLVACLAVGLGCSMLPDLDVRRRAKQAKRELTRAACMYLDLVALERAASAGPAQALEQAAGIAEGTSFRRIASAMRAAELDGRHAWDGLAELGERTGVAALVDAADIMRMSGQDGAAVYNTLRARAASLRGQILAETTAQAHADSEHMVIPATALVAVFVAFVGYPFLASLLG